MISGSAALLSLFIGVAVTPTMERVTYSPVPARFASATLLVDGRTGSVQVLDQNNIEIKVIPSEYQDLKISKAFALECVFPHSYRLKTIDARVDSRYHLVPLNVLEYKEYNPSYIKLEVDKSFFENRTDNYLSRNHKVYIYFLTDSE